MVFLVIRFLLPLFVLVFGGAFTYGSYVYIPEHYPVSIKLSMPQSVSTSTEKILDKHIKTPVPLRAIYMTACVASLKTWREKLLTLADETEINAIVIDVKDYTGTISIPADPLKIEGVTGKGCKVPDMKDFIDEMHSRGVYAIARVAVFQDQLYANRHPDLAIKKKSDHSVIWRDRKGLPFIDAGATPYWDYIVSIGQVAYDAGFDEINFDYIRFPTDGNMTDIYYPWSNATTSADKSFGRAKVLRSFFEYLRDAFPENSTSSPKISADFFGMTTSVYDDMSIGQVLEDAFPNFDYIAPMVYPSHYPSGFEGIQNVNAEPYKVVKLAMDKGVLRAIMASTSPSKLRPWLQDNDYPVPYSPEMVRAQMQATYDAGLDSWMLWDPSNKYTREALLGPEGELRNKIKN